MGSLRKLRRHGGSRRRFRSGLEDKVIEDLEARNVIYEYEPDTISYEEPIRSSRCGECGSRLCLQKRKYTPDLKFGSHEGFFYVEVKGKLDARTRGRMERFLKSPQGRAIDLRFLFQRDNWCTSKHLHRYSDWAEKLGLRWHIGETIPQEWLEDASSN